MLRSMTGYGRAERTVDGFHLTTEIKAVNHRYFDVVFRMPREYLPFEDSLKKTVAVHVRRGRLEIYIAVERTAPPERQLTVDMSLAERLKDAAVELGERLGLPNDLSVADLLYFPELWKVQEEAVEQEKLGPLLQSCVEEAVLALVHMREKEGERLTTDFRDRIQGLQRIIRYMEQRSPQSVKEYKDKLEERLREWLRESAPVEPTRLLTEVALMADRVSIAEELVRLQSHVSQFLAALDADEPVGRKLDFMLQEMNREVNTIGSKVNDYPLSAAVVEAKSLLEQIREQVQNVE